MAYIVWFPTNFVFTIVDTLTSRALVHGDNTAAIKQSAIRLPSQKSGVITSSCNDPTLFDLANVWQIALLQLYCHHDEWAVQSARLNRPFPFRRTPDVTSLINVLHELG